MADVRVANDRVLVLGIGNILMKDEGIGCRVIEELLEQYEFPENVVVEDSGTMGMRMLHMLTEFGFVIVVDAMDGTGHPPGTVLRLAPEDLAPNQVMHSLHDIRFTDVLDATEILGKRPEAECVGIQIEDMQPVDLTIGLTDAVEAAIDTAIDAVITVLAERGVEVRGRGEATPG